MPVGAKTIELCFGEEAAARPAAAANGAAAQWPPEHPERLAQFWSRVSSDTDKVAAAAEVRWSRCRLSPADGAVMAVAFHLAARVRCEGSFGEGLGNLLVLNLEANDLRCEGLEALEPALDGERVFPALRELYLMNNRIGDRGVQVLLRRELPQLKILSLQDNSIGDDGMRAFARAIQAKTFRVRHLNVLDNTCGLGSAMEELKEAVKGCYVELRAPKVATAKAVMRGTA